MREEKVREYEDEYRRLSNLGDVKGQIDLMRQALKEFPRNFQFMRYLAYALTIYRFTGEQLKERNEKGYAEEAIKLCEQILEDCTDDNTRHSAIKILCHEYPDFGKEDRAKELAMKMPDMAVCSEMLLENILTGEEKIEQMQRNILMNINWAAQSLKYLAYNDNMGRELTARQKIQFIEAANKLYETVMPDGDYLFYNCSLARNYYELAELWAAAGEKGKALESLNAATKCAEDYDNLPDRMKHTSLFINRCEFNRKSTIKNYMESECRILYNGMSGPTFDNMRDMPEFKELYERLGSIESRNSKNNACL